MSLVERPQRVADEIEWVLLKELSTEISRGDIAVDFSFDGVPERRSADIELEPDTMLERAIDDCFDHFVYRAATFAGSYVFDVSRDVIRKPNVAETDQSLVYRFLLSCSRTELSQALSASFSDLCKLALQRFLGSRAKVWNVDAGSSDRKAIGTSTEQVARFLEPHLAAKVNEDYISHLPDIGGDGGVDLIATFGFEDAAHGAVALLGQCASSSDTKYWRDKIYQPLRFKSLFTWTSKPVLASFIPYVYRSANGAWLNPINVGTLLFDRYRLIRALNLEQEPLPTPFKAMILDAMSAAEKKAKVKKKRSQKTVLKKGKSAKKAPKNINKTATKETALKNGRSLGSRNAKKAPARTKSR